jgi:hypothetical protein
MPSSLALPVPFLSSTLTPRRDGCTRVHRAQCRRWSRVSNLRSNHAVLMTGLLSGGTSSLIHGSRQHASHRPPTDAGANEHHDSRTASRSAIETAVFGWLAVRVPVASSAASEVIWRSVRSDVVPRVLWGLPENIAADIRLVGPWRSLSGPCNGPLRSSTCMVTRQPSAQITWHPTSAALADIRSQRTMPSACGGARPSSPAVRAEPASVPVSFRPPGCSPTTDLAQFGSAVQRLSRAASRSVTGSAVHVPKADRRTSRKFPSSQRPQG